MVPPPLRWQTFKSLPAQSSPPVTSIHLVEQSDALKAVQKAALEKSGFGQTPVFWHRNVEEVPKSKQDERKHNEKSTEHERSHVHRQVKMNSRSRLRTNSLTRCRYTFSR